MKIQFLLFLMVLFYWGCDHPQVQNLKKAEAIRPEIAYCEQPGVQSSVHCPSGLGNIFLPRSFHARAIYVGYSNDGYHLKFLRQLIDLANSTEPRPFVNILIPRFELKEALGDFKNYFKSPQGKYVNFIPTPADDSLWAQDYFEILFNTKTGQSIVLDLPYPDREGEYIPTALSLYCKKDIIDQPDKLRKGNINYASDYGGNIEPLSDQILTIGNNMSKELIDLIRKVTSQNVLQLDVQWLDTGHVDELISLLPHKLSASACDQSIMYSSPELALSLLDKIDLSLVDKNLLLEANLDKDEPWPDFFQCLDIKNHSRPLCQKFIQANKTYERIQKTNVAKIQEVFRKYHGCELETIAAPQLFKPYTLQKKFGTEKDQAIAFNENSVNNIFFWPNLVLPRQTIIPFHDHLKKALSKFDYRIHFVEGRLVHELMGGIHCATNISYGCKP